MKTLITESPVTSAFQWVEGHLVEKKGLKHCTHPEITNGLVDRLADLAYHRSIQLQNSIDSNFPFEKLQLKPNEKSHRGSLQRNGQSHRRTNRPEILLQNLAGSAEKISRQFGGME